MSPAASRHPLPTTSTPPWEVLVLVAHRLDPRTLTVASCVCRSWASSMSSDCVWEPVCSAHYPSLSHLRSAADPSVPFYRIFSIGLAASKRRHRSPPPPRLSLGSLVFMVDMWGPSFPATTMVKSGDELRLQLGQNCNLFEFDIENTSSGCLSTVDTSSHRVRLTWNVVMKGWKEVFTLMDRSGDVSLRPGTDGWFSEELPPQSGCCTSSRDSGGIIADVKITKIGVFGQLGDSIVEKVKVEKARVALLSAVSWRYLSEDDGLRYLQHFLGPNE